MQTTRRLMSIAVCAVTSLLMVPVAVPAVAEGLAAGTMRSAFGSYLAGRIARSANDTTNAVHFYRKSLAAAQNDPRIIERAFLVEAAEGNTDRVLQLARKLIKFRPQHRLANAWLGLAAFKDGNYRQADRYFKSADTGPIGELTSALSRAWVATAAKRRKDAFARLKYSQRAEWAQYYLRYHRALIADLANQKATARKNYSRIFKADARMPRIAIGYLSHAANARNFKLVQEIAARNREAASGEVHPAVADVIARIDGRKPIPLMIRSARDGMAEVYYGLGEALATEGGMNLGAIYLQMALFVRPKSPFALAALANVYETTKRYERANETYARIPKSSPLQFSIDIRRASNLDSMEQTDAAKDVLLALAKQHPSDVRPVEALANILRGRKRYREAIKYYDQVLKLVGDPKPRHWTYWYARGTCFERIKDWPSAERDLLKANALSPDQPLVLNYLGYSWVDQNQNLKRGLKLIEKAVQLKPDDGYIVDSLGWAHFRLGNYEKAVKYLERAVELRPADPILNDHLGDALWRVGRIREARFQWDQALTLKPEPDDEKKIRSKLASGLPKLGVIKATAGDGGEKEKPLGRRVESKVPATQKAPIR